MHHIIKEIIEFAIVLGIMVLIHELGHFAVAKWCGIRVETFSIGMGPRIFGFRRGDTDYRISLLPLGGYVKMAGDIPGEEPSGDPGEFNAHPRWHRTLVALAGPIANFILSFLILIPVGMYHHEIDEFLDGPATVDYVPLNSAAAHSGLATGDTITKFTVDNNPTWNQVFNDCLLHENAPVPFEFTHEGRVTSGTLPCILDKNTLVFGAQMLQAGIVPKLQLQPVAVDIVSESGPAGQAGLKPGDKVVRVDNFAPHSADPGMVSYLKDRNGAPVVLTVLRDGQLLTINITPAMLPGTNGDIGWRLGFSNSVRPMKVERLDFKSAVSQSVKDNLNNSTMTFRILKGLFTRHVSVKNLSGPVGIAQQIDIAAQNGHWALLQFMAFISLQLGIFNLLPIPILDGGMILFLAIEALMRRDLNQQIKERVYQVAFVCLIMFAVFVFYNDLTRH